MSSWPPLLEDPSAMRQALRDVVYGELPELAVGTLEGEAAGPDGAKVTTVFLPGERRLEALVALPARPRAVLFGLNFHGNHALSEEPWVPGPLSERGHEPDTFPFRRINARGYGLVTVHAADIAPDDPVRAEPILRRFSPTAGLIGLWGWGLASLAATLDLGVPVVTTGHSRMGKAALAAAALFGGVAAVAPIQSGTGGAAPWRKQVGETREQITAAFPHWFHPGLAARPGELPLDQHWALACCAPAAVLLLDAEEDTWADPAGAVEMLRQAAPAWRTPVRNRAWCRPGGHRVEPEDWTALLDWLDTVF